MSIPRTDRLAGEFVFITGASSGIGEHTARLFAASGAIVALGARRTDLLERIVGEIHAGGGRAYAVDLDVTYEAMVPAAFDRVETAAGSPLTVLVNNAGIAVAESALTMTHAAWNKVFDTNLTGAFLVAQAFAKRRIAAGAGGAIVNVSSIVGERPAAALAAYGAAKAGLSHLTTSLAMEWARYDIRVNSLAPGYIETDLNRAFFRTPAGTALLARIPQRRLGSPSDLDGALLLLASKESQYMTGSTITVDGGLVVGNL
jgi:NAD(P)-dependent dehydrogenase (short-subunit alcohol dehydrogenase family)